MKQVKINNFYKMTGNYKKVSVNDKENIHKKIINFVPSYSEIVSETLDAEVFSKATPQFPLVISKPLGTTMFSYGEMMASMVNGYTGFSPIAVTTGGKVYDGVNLLANMASIWSVNFNETADVSWLFDKIFVSSNNSDSIMYIPTSGGSSQGIVGFGTTGIEISKSMVPFLNGLYVSSGNTLHKINSGLIRETVASINNFSIRKLDNYNDQYLICIASTEQSAQSTGNEWYVLWHNGTSQTFSYKSSIKGQYLCSGKNGGTYYVFSVDGNDLVVSVIESFSLKEIGRMGGFTQIFPTLSTRGINYRNKLCFIENYAIFPVTYLGNKSLLKWNLSTGESSIIIQDSTNPTNTVFSFGSAGGSKFLINRVGESSMREIDFYTGSQSQTASYQSNLFSFQEERVKINRVDIVFDPTFPSVNHKLNFNLDYTDNLLSPNFANFNKVNLTSNTPSLDTTIKVHPTRVLIEDIGIIGTDFKISLDVINPNNWDLVIREIIIHYEEVSQLE